MQAAVLTARWDRAIDAVGEPAWQAAASGRSFFLSYPWLRGAERTLTPDPCYLSLWHDGDAVACAPAQHVVDGGGYYYYDLPRILAESDGAAGVLRERRQELYPALLAVANGMAAGLCLRQDLPGPERAAAARAAVEALADRAESVSAPVTGWLYLARDDDPELAASLDAAGFATGTVSAECVLPVRWGSFDDYVQSLSKKRRYVVRREAAAFENAGLRMEVGDASALTPEIAGLQAQLRAKYGHPSDLAAILRSFHQMRERLAPYVRVFTARRGGAAVGFVLVLAYDGVYYTKSAGFDYGSLGADFCYFTVLFYEPVRRAIEDGTRLIHYGIDSYDAKLMRGCRLRPLDAAVRFSGPLARELGEAFGRYSAATAECFGALAAKHGAR